MKNRVTHPLRVAENCTTHPLHKAQNLMTHPLSAPAHPLYTFWSVPYAGRIHGLRLLTYRVRTPVKTFRRFFIVSYRLFVFCSFHILCFLLGFSFINDKSFTFFRQISTCALRIPIPAPARNPFSHLSLNFWRLTRRSIGAAMLVVKNKSISLLWELTSIFT